MTQAKFVVLVAGLNDLSDSVQFDLISSEIKGSKFSILVKTFTNC